MLRLSQVVALGYQLPARGGRQIFDDKWLILFVSILGFGMPGGLFGRC